MEFSELQELNSMIAYSKIDRQSYLLESKKLAGFKQHISRQNQLPDYLNQKTFEQYLQSPQSPILQQQVGQQSGFSQQQLNEKLRQVQIDENENETIENLLKDIEIISAMISDVNQNGDMLRYLPLKRTKTLGVGGGVNELNIVEEQQQLGAEKQSQVGQAFQRVQTDDFAKSLRQAKSFFSVRMRNVQSINQKQSKSRVSSKTIKVYILGYPIYIMVEVDNNESVGDVIKSVLLQYQIDEEKDQTILKYQDIPDAYELRMVDDDIEYKPELGIPALSKDRNFCEYNLNTLVFWEIKDFQPSEADQEKKGELHNKLDKIKQIVKDKNKVLIHITNLEDKFSTYIQIDPDKLVRDLFPLIAKKIKHITQQNYLVRLAAGSTTFSNNDNNKTHEFEEQTEFINLNIPIKNLQIFKLELVKKKFADAPKDFDMKSTFLESRAENVGNSSDEAENLEEIAIMYNEISASKYEEFQVIKINSRGKRQPRMIGIDRNKLYNLLIKKKKASQNTLTGLINSVFSSVSTQNPERPLSDVVDIKCTPGNKYFEIIVQEEGGQKVLRYDAPTKNIATRIISKIRYLKNLEAPKTKKY